MKLFILPFDHRSSFLKLSKDKKEVEKLKKIIWHAFLDVYEKYNSKKSLGILVDETYGSEIIKEAKAKNICLCVPVEKSGQDVFQLEYKNLNDIKKINPNYIKVLVRYNPFNLKINQKQLTELKKVNDFCKKNNYKLIFELLVPPTKEDLKINKNYDKELRLDRTLQAIQEIQAKINIDIWKLEGFSKKGWKEIVNILDNDAKIIFLGRGASKSQVKTWLTHAKTNKTIIGFAIGRTIFLEPLKQFLNGKINEEKAKFKIANNFQYFIDLWNEE